MEDRAIAHFVRRGGHLTAALGKVTTLSIQDVDFKAEDYGHLAAFKDLAELNLSNCGVTDAVWPSIAGLRRLRHLGLWNSEITDNGFKTVEQFPELRVLDVGDTSIGDASLQHIGELENLENLLLFGTRITGDGIAALSGLTKLRHLSIVKTSVDDKGLVTIGRFESLRILELDNTRISNEGVAQLAGLNQLRMLSIAGNDAVNEKALRHLEDLPLLESLYICVPVTDAGLSSLRKMQALRNLYIGDVENDGRRWLERELPSVGVY